MRFTFTQLAGGAKVTFLNPSLALSKKVERDSPSPRRNDCKIWNDWMAQWKWQNGSYSYWCHNTLGRELFFRSGEEDKCYQMLSRQDRRENSIHDTFSTKEVEKRRWSRWILVVITSHVSHSAVALLSVCVCHIYIKINKLQNIKACQYYQQCAISISFDICCRTLIAKWI